MTYAYDSWVRSYTDIYGELIIEGAGSAGAGDHFSWSGFIEAAGITYDLDIPAFDGWILLD